MLGLQRSFVNIWTTKQRLKERLLSIQNRVSYWCNRLSIHRVMTLFLHCQLILYTLNNFYVHFNIVSIVSGFKNSALLNILVHLIGTLGFCVHEYVLWYHVNISYVSLPFVDLPIGLPSCTKAPLCPLGLRLSSPLFSV